MHRPHKLHVTRTPTHDLWHRQFLEHRFNNDRQICSKQFALLLKNHGVFTIGKDGKSAVKAAVMTEDVAHTVWIALQLGTPDEIRPDDVAKLHDRYLNVYGQR